MARCAELFSLAPVSSDKEREQSRRAGTDLRDRFLRASALVVAAVLWQPLNVVASDAGVCNEEGAIRYY